MSDLAAIGIAGYLGHLIWRLGASPSPWPVGALASCENPAETQSKAVEEWKQKRRLGTPEPVSHHLPSPEHRKCCGRELHPVFRRLGYDTLEPRSTEKLVRLSCFSLPQLPQAGVRTIQSVDLLEERGIPVPLFRIVNEMRAELLFALHAKIEKMSGER
ncbi:MAG: hypothetical protein HY712_06525 [candidate division NC10 bacterium]|nr:hypothetical protein [candidate division NC10 bacterium]